MEVIIKNNIKNYNYVNRQIRQNCSVNYDYSTEHYVHPCTILLAFVSDNNSYDSNAFCKSDGIHL